MKRRNETNNLRRQKNKFNPEQPFWLKCGGKNSFVLLKHIHGQLSMKYVIPDKPVALTQVVPPISTVELSEKNVLEKNVEFWFLVEVSQYAGKPKERDDEK